jgi:hypothetical protein
MVGQEEIPPTRAVGDVKFLVDRMLGRLAKWLRILGYDAVYARISAPLGLMWEARRQGRFILTRDTRLARGRDAPPHLIVESDRFREQLRQVVRALGLEPLSKLLTRCIECNRPLEGVAKERVRDKVPPYVWETQDSFLTCAGCGRVYWGATHREHILEELRRMALLEQG